jgi:hypothetical protein
MYVSAIGLGSSYSIDGIQDRVGEYECGKCGCYYRDPFFDNRIETELYLTHAPVHNAGWTNFHHSISNSPALDSKPTLIGNFLRKEYGTLEHYAEWGCPFNGLLLSENRYRILEHTIERLSKRDQYENRRRNRFQAYSIRVNSLALKINTLMLQVLRRKNPSRSSQSYYGAEQTYENGYLIMDQSTTRWGVGCTSYGLNCLQCINGVAGIQVVNLDRDRYRENPLDAIVFANVWDHLSDPLGKLRAALDCARFVIVWGHSVEESHIQHRYAMPANFANISELAGANWRNLALEIPNWPSNWQIAIFWKKESN